MSKQIHQVLLRWTNHYGDIFRIRAAHRHVVIVTNPYLAADLLRNPEAADKTPQLYRCVIVPFSDKNLSNLLSHSTNDHWRLIRKAIMPAFSLASLRQAFPAMQKIQAQTRALLQRQDGEEAVNVSDLLACEGLDVIGAVAFAMDMGALARLGGQREGVDRLALTRATMREGGKLLGDLFRPYRVWDPDVRKGKQDVAAFIAMIKDLLADLRGRKGLDPNTVAGRLLQVQDPVSGEPLSDDHIVPELGNVLTAGKLLRAILLERLGWTGTSLVWPPTTWIPHQHPEVQAKLEAELERAGLLAGGSQPPRPLAWDDLSALVYLDAVIKEALRMYSVVVATGRTALRDFTLGGRFFIPKGTELMVPMIALGRSERNWEEANSFRPERFLDPEASFAKPDPSFCSTHDKQKTSNRPVKRYIPFSEGVRICAGRALAHVYMAATLASLLSHFTFKLAERMGGAEGVYRAEVMTGPLTVEGGLYMHCIPRVPSTAQPATELRS